MEDNTIRFDDGASYEEHMGKWSRLVGAQFLDWLAPAPGLRWLDVGCGNGAFTALLLERCAPDQVLGLDPSAGQLDYARSRFSSSAVSFQIGDAEALPVADGSFDAAVMALVIFFVPDPAKGVAEMMRAVKPGGTVSAYAWDFIGGGFPFAALQQEMAALGSPPLWPPSVDAGRADHLHRLWVDAGLEEVESHEIVVTRSFADFETFWQISRTGPRVEPRLAAMPAGDVATLKTRLRARFADDAQGRITYSTSANAIKGRTPGRAGRN